MRTVFTLALVGLGCAAVPGYAITTFDFTQCTNNQIGQVETSACGSSSYSNFSNQFSQTVGGVKVTAYALTTASTATGSDTSLNAYTANVGQYSGNGLGVCSAGDTTCGDPQHQIDNNKSYEFILFQFSTPVTLSDITLANFGVRTTSGSTSTVNGAGDMDLSYWTGVSTASTTFGSITNLGSGWSSQNNTPCTGTKESTGCGTTQTNGQVMVDDSLSRSNVTYLLVGTAYDLTSGCHTATTTCGNSDAAPDFFKVQSLSIAGGGGSSETSTAPEPATFGLLGLSIAALGIVARKRTADGLVGPRS